MAWTDINAYEYDELYVLQSDYAEALEKIQARTSWLRYANGVSDNREIQLNQFMGVLLQRLGQINTEIAEILDAIDEDVDALEKADFTIASTDVTDEASVLLALETQIDALALASDYVIEKVSYTAPDTESGSYVFTVTLEFRGKEGETKELTMAITI
ncbi:MAG: hypothetical protein PHN69_03850 [Candidatus Pacebacteria bacterium]|nr:hypothetical protein [Candidatus Paceibacterota bacterium]